MQESKFESCENDFVILISASCFIPSMASSSEINSRYMCIQYMQQYASQFEADNFRALCNVENGFAYKG